MNDDRLLPKYHVQRLNDKAGKHNECAYFVLDSTHDRYAQAALLAYAGACESEFPGLALDLRELAAAKPTGFGGPPVE